MSKINCFIPFLNAEQVEKTVAGLKESALVSKIFLLAGADAEGTVEGCEKIDIKGLESSDTMKKIAANADADYVLLYTKYNTLEFGMFALERMVRIANDSAAGMVYADHYNVVGDTKSNAPVIDYQEGSLRNDFDFGSVLMFNAAAFKNAAAKISKEYEFAGLYDIRLKVTQEGAELVHINEYLYSDVENDTRKSGEKIFDYVDPRNRGVQIEMEEACTDHLKVIGGYLAPEFKKIEFDKGDFEYEASVIIPVRNRIRTIRDAIKSVLMQKTDFKFNLIVIDNLSTDGTTEAIDEFKDDERLIHIIPERNDLGIGGCWNLGVHHPKCGKFAIQLDSDDVYKDENTLTTMVNAFYEQNCAMVVGTYMMTDFNMNMIAPGIIDHKEWTPENGRNNALRINGLGAPRAFYTPVLREVKVPNTSYGEDYALGLNFSREYQIGRVYDVVYLCRRWDDNSDASLDVVKMNGHNLYKDRIRTWELKARIAFNKNKKIMQKLDKNMVASFLNRQIEDWDTANKNFTALKDVKVKTFTIGKSNFKVQFNPARITSSAAKVDPKSLKERKCFLCAANRPAIQEGIEWGKYTVLVNPFPIFPRHLTIPDNGHVDQKIEGRIADMMNLVAALEDYTLFYNGPKCGASAPDHMHFQGGNCGFMPVEEDINNADKAEVAVAGNSKMFLAKGLAQSCFFIEAQCVEEGEELFNRLYAQLTTPEGEIEPMLNILCRYTGSEWNIFVFPRKKHRPDCYFKEGDENILISPASVDMGGVFITPLEKDFEKITAEDVKTILDEVCLSEQEAQEIADKL